MFPGNNGIILYAAMEQSSLEPHLDTCVDVVVIFDTHTHTLQVQS